ncbi:hypothetical protein ACFVXE_32460 [Streptomyces sp. NPDC058231]|uniref:hypothetical protein n=1 Tax=Streptomyces sp. NPDC058231 TaxID=3346392 RepID=UPI0036E71D32
MYTGTDDIDGAVFDGNDRAGGFFGGPVNIVTGSSGTRVLDRFALAVRECVRQGSPRKFAVLVELGEFEPVPENVSDRRKALKGFIDGYVPSALKAQGCS